MAPNTNAASTDAQPLHFAPSNECKRRAAKVVANPFLKKRFRGAMDFLMMRRATKEQITVLFAEKVPEGELY